MRPAYGLLGAALLLAAACGGDRGGAPARAARSIVVATTTSLQDSGLLDVLVAAFEERTGIDVKPIAVGSGAALDMAARGEADAVVSHAPEAEAEYVARGDLIEGRRLMHNDFLILGPRDDPARVRGQPSAEAAFAAIARGGTFVSRGDRSGTELMELAIWRRARVEPRALGRRRVLTGQGMGATLFVADERNAYTLADRGTWLALSRRLRLVPLYENGRSLVNVYRAYVVNPATHPRVDAGGGRAFVEFLSSSEAQRLIAAHGVAEHGRALFSPAADSSRAR